MDRWSRFRGLAPPGAPWDYAQRNLRFPDPKASRELDQPGSVRATSRREKGSMRHERAKRSPSLRPVTCQPKLWSCCFQWLSYPPQPRGDRSIVSGRELPSELMPSESRKGFTVVRPYPWVSQNIPSDTKIYTYPRLI